MNKTISEKIDAQIPHTPQLQKIISRARDLFELDEKNRFALELILDEVLTNSISYGQYENTPLEISCEITGNCSEITITVIDNGPPFNPLESPPPDLNLPLQERPIGGLGLLIVNKLIQEGTYSRQDSKNILTLLRKIRND